MRLDLDRKKVCGHRRLGDRPRSWGGSRSGPPFQFVRTGARPCAPRPRPRSRRRAHKKMCRHAPTMAADHDQMPHCDAAESGGILRFSRIIRIMLSPHWQFSADLHSKHSHHSTSSGSAHVSRRVAMRRWRPGIGANRTPIRPAAVSNLFRRNSPKYRPIAFRRPSPDGPTLQPYTLKHRLQLSNVR